MRIRSALAEVLESLPEEDRLLIRLRFYANRTQSETAKVLHTTQVQISRRERKILVLLRRRAFGRMSDRMSKAERKNWKKRKANFLKKCEKRACFLSGVCAKIHYCQADV